MEKATVLNNGNRITIIAGTNREKSNSALVGSHYARILSSIGAEPLTLDLRMLPHDFIFTDMFGERSVAMEKVIHDYLEMSGKFVFVIPEYNGGFPGVLKAFVDAVPPRVFHGKKAGLIGLSSGHAGGLRPLDQFTNVLNYLQVNVLHLKPKLSNIDGAIDAGELTNARAKELLLRHAELMVNF